MRSHFLYEYLAVLSLTTSLSTAQDLSNLPKCAQAPILSSISSIGCQLTDIACICNDTAFASSLDPLIRKECSPDDYQKVSTFTAQLCGSVGVTVSGLASASMSGSAFGGSSASPTGGSKTASTSASLANPSLLPSGQGTSAAVRVTGRWLVGMMLGFNAAGFCGVGLGLI